MPQMSASLKSRSSFRDLSSPGANSQGESIATGLGHVFFPEATPSSTPPIFSGPATIRRPSTAQPWNPLRRPPTSMPTTVTGSAELLRFQPAVAEFERQDLVVGLVRVRGQFGED